MKTNDMKVYERLAKEISEKPYAGSFVVRKNVIHISAYLKNVVLTKYLLDLKIPKFDICSLGNEYSGCGGGGKCLGIRDGKGNTPLELCDEETKKFFMKLIRDT